METCGICCEKFTKCMRKPHTCLYCQEVNCIECVKKYLLSTDLDPHCMSCRKLWNREFIDQSLTKAFCSGPLKEHREDVLLVREKCYLPAAVPRVDEVKETRKNTARLAEVRKAMAELRREEMMLIVSLRYRSKTPTYAVQRKCPTEGCRGFLDGTWYCNVCDVTTCKDCNEPLVDDHECNPDSVETCKMLAKDTKPCPSCGTLIFKISGCSQMWCPNCHNAFCWNTLRIETGVIHNPHYYEFQRLTGSVERQPGDIPCGGLPTIYELRGLDRKYYSIHRLINHISHVELQNAPEPDFEKYRVMFLMNEITENDWKRKLQRIEKQREKRRDIQFVLRMFVDTGSELFRGVIGNAQEDESLDKLREYFNDVMMSISLRYNRTIVPNISMEWKYIKAKNIK